MHLDNLEFEVLWLVSIWLAGKASLKGKHLEHIAGSYNVASRLKIVSDFSPSLKAAAKKGGRGCPLPRPSAECCLPAFHLWLGTLSLSSHISISSWLQTVPSGKWALKCPDEVA